MVVAVVLLAVENSAESEGAGTTTEDMIELCVTVHTIKDDDACTYIYRANSEYMVDEHLIAGTCAPRTER
jgi:hypothetical protein